MIGHMRLPKEMKLAIEPLVTGDTTYKKGIVTNLRKPAGMHPEASGLGFGADKNGFFVHTHRARSKSYVDPTKIPKKAIAFINSTG